MKRSASYKPLGVRAARAGNIPRQSRWMRSGACLLTLLALLCACSNPEAEDSALYAAATQGTQILSGAEEPVATAPVQTFAVSYLPDEGFNPFTCESTVNRTLFTFLYDSLFIVTGDFEAEPALCASFSVSEDQMTYRFNLVSGVRFSDGTPLSADDAVASIQAGMQSKFYSGRLSHITSIQALDAGTLEITLDTPFENLPLVLDIPIVKADTIDQDIPLGTGPYWVSGSTLCRNETGQPTAPLIDVDVIRMIAATSANQIRDAFEFGQTNLVCTDPNAAGSTGYHCNYDVWDCSTTIMQYIGFNQLDGPFASQTLRAGVTHGIDRTALINQALSDYALAASLPCSPRSAFYDGAMANDYAYLPSAFQAAVRDSGAFNTPEDPADFLVCSAEASRVSAAQAIAEQLEAQGFYVSVRSLDYDGYREALESGEFDLYYGEVKLPANFDLSCFYAADAPLAYGGIADNEIAQLCLDALKNSGAYQDLFAAVMQDAAICPVLFKNYAVYMDRGAVEYLYPAVDNVLRVPSGRTLLDANVPFDNSPAETDESQH